jgi:hypothetical protein
VVHLFPKPIRPLPWPANRLFGRLQVKHVWKAYRPRKIVYCQWVNPKKLGRSMLVRFVPILCDERPKHPVLGTSRQNVGDDELHVMLEVDVSYTYL